MKKHRLQFQDSFLPDLDSGRKTATIRLSRQPFKVGDRVAVVKNRFDKYEAATRFIRITAKDTIPWRDVTDEHLAKTQADRSWYKARYGERLTDDTPVTFIEFKVLREEIGERWQDL